MNWGLQIKLVKLSEEHESTILHSLKAQIQFLSPVLVEILEKYSSKLKIHIKNFETPKDSPGYLPWGRKEDATNHNVTTWTRRDDLELISIG